MLTPAITTAQDVLSTVIVRLAPGVELKDWSSSAAAQLSTAGGAMGARRVVETGVGNALLSGSALDRYVIVRLQGISAPQAILLLQSVGGIESIAENHRYHINTLSDDSLSAEQWGLERIDADKAWGRATGKGVVVGVIDTGIDWNHPDLRNGLAVNQPEDRNGNGWFEAWPLDVRIEGVAGDLDGIDQDGNGFVDDVIGYDFVDQRVANVGDWRNPESAPLDENGHGTNVAGVIGAQRNNGIGIAGVAPSSKVVAARAFDATGNGEDDDIAAAIVYCVMRGARVLNMSFGDYYRSDLLRDAVAFARSQGVVVVASSGNEGISLSHYPSSFSGVISVGATTQGDVLSSFSTYGSQISVSAPGSGIITTAVGGTYEHASGTSFSSPHVAGVAALLVELHPNWNPNEIRTAIALTTDDLGSSGWDIYHGAGRLNAGRAVEFPGPPSLVITEPVIDDGLMGDTVVQIIGSAFSPLLDFWTLDIGSGDLPSEWKEITEATHEGRVLSRLGSFRASDLPSGVHTLRLRLRQKNGFETEMRVRISIGNKAPSILTLDTGRVWLRDRRAWNCVVATDQLTTLRILVRPSGGPDSLFREIPPEDERRGLRQLHQVLVTSGELSPGMPYDAIIEVRNASGAITTLGSDVAPLRIVVEPSAFATSGFHRSKWHLPYGYILDRLFELSPGGERAVALNRFTESGDFGGLFIYALRDSFVVLDSTLLRWAPRDVGDVDGSGSVSLLGQSFGDAVVYNQITPGGSPLASVRYIDTTSSDFYAARFIDVDGDGRDEILARSGNERGGSYYVARLDGARLTRIDTLPNTTRPAAGDGKNFSGPPVAGVGKFTGNGRVGVVLADEDADLLLYERGEDGRFHLLWSEEHDGVEGSEFVVACDVDGDGRDEAVIAWHSSLSLPAGADAQPQFWTVRIYSFGDNGAGSLRYQDRFAYVRPTNTLRSGVGAGDIDGRAGDEIALGLFPSLYVIRWDAASSSFRPLWYRTGVVGNRPMIADIDGDGLSEIGVGDGEEIRFFATTESNISLQSPGGLAAWGASDSTVLVRWYPVESADYYTLYRGRPDGSGSIRFDSIAATTSLTLLDTGLRTPSGRLDAATLYYYAVTSRRNADTLEGPTDAIVAAVTLAPIRPLSSRGVEPASFVVDLSDRVTLDPVRTGSFRVVDGDGMPIDISSIIRYGDSSVLITLHKPFADTLRVTATDLLKNIYNAPADTVASITIVGAEAERPGTRFIATAASAIDPLTIAIDFNAVPSDSALLDPSRFVLAPAGHVLSVRRDLDSPTRLLLQLDADFPLGSYGKNYTVKITGIHAIDGRPINNGAGSVVGFVINAETLDSLFAFPQPFSYERDATVTIGGLTREATVEIYTQGGRPIRRLNATEGNGGVIWDGRDEYGNRVATGVYIYRAIGNLADGTEIYGGPAKIVVVP